jgi:4-phytase/acid phosphatase
MFPHPNPPFRLPLIWRLAATLLLGLGWLVPTNRAAAADSELKFALILSRHGIRAPLDAQEAYQKYAAQAWPKWEVPSGHLTARGGRQMEIIGAYYRAVYVQAGLLSGDAERDAALVYFRANNEQRTIESARRLGAALLPGLRPEVHARPAGETDPLFRAAKVPLGQIDRARAINALLGRVGGDVHAVALAQRPAFATLEHVLLGDAARPEGKALLLDQPSTVAPGDGENTVVLRGPLGLAASMTDVFMLQYSEGHPMSEVGWGRLTREGLTQLLGVHSIYYNLKVGTFFVAQVEFSNLARHLGDTLAQAASGQAQPGAMGKPGQKLAIVVGHETTQLGLAGLLNLNWRLPGTQLNPALLGGALVFELRQRRSDGQFFVRANYVSPTLEQTRELAALTPENPPAIAPIFIPGCGEAGAGFDAPLEQFEALLRQVIDPQFTAPGAE